jgi:hypothetical protein
MQDMTGRDSLLIAAALEQLSDEALGRAVRAALAGSVQGREGEDSRTDDEMDGSLRTFGLATPSPEYRKAANIRGPRMQVDMGAWKGICRRMGSLEGRTPEVVARELIDQLRQAPSFQKARLLAMVLRDALAERRAKPELAALCQEATQVLLTVDLDARPAAAQE